MRVSSRVHQYPGRCAGVRGAARDRVVIAPRLAGAPRVFRRLCNDCAAWDAMNARRRTKCNAKPVPTQARTRSGASRAHRSASVRGKRAPLRARSGVFASQALLCARKGDDPRILKNFASAIGNFVDFFRLFKRSAHRMRLGGGAHVCTRRRPHHGVTGSTERGRDPWCWGSGGIGPLLSLARPCFNVMRPTIARSRGPRSQGVA